MSWDASRLVNVAEELGCWPFCHLSDSALVFQVLSGNASLRIPTLFGCPTQLSLVADPPRQEHQVCLE